MRKIVNKLNQPLLTLVAYFAYQNMAFADGTDILKDVTKDLFASFVGTGIELLLLMEICAGVYLFSSGQRTVKNFVGFAIVLLITAYAKVRFGG